MGREQCRRVRTEEIRDLSRTVKIGSHVVFVKAFAVGGQSAGRYEVNLHCGGQTAILDVPAGSRAHVEERIQQVVGSFVESSRLRQPA